MGGAEPRGDQHRTRHNGHEVLVQAPILSLILFRTDALGDYPLMESPRMPAAVDLLRERRAMENGESAWEWHRTPHARTT